MSLIRIPVLFCIFGTCMLPAAQVQPLIGPLLQGDALNIDNEATVHLGEHQLALRRCDWLALHDEAVWHRPEWARVPAALVLRSGSYLPVESIVGVASGDRLALVGPFGVMQLPLNVVQSWGRRDAVLERPDGAENADLVVLVNGQHVAGQVLAAEPGLLRMRTDLDEQPLGIPWERITAVHLRAVATEQAGLHLACQHDPHLPAVLLSPRQPFSLIDAPEALIDPHMLLPRLRIRGGDAVPLSRIDPIQVEQTGAFDVVWPYARDSVIGGGPLLLGGRRYATGLTIHSAADLRWSLDMAYQRFQSRIGIADTMALAGDCIVRILLDDQEVWRARIRGGEEPREVDVDCSQAAVLALVVELGERYDIGDHVVFADARLIRKP